MRSVWRLQVVVLLICILLYRQVFLLCLCPPHLYHQQQACPRARQHGDCRSRGSNRKPSDLWTTPLPNHSRFWFLTFDTGCCTDDFYHLTSPQRSDSYFANSSHGDHAHPKLSLCCLCKQQCLCWPHFHITAVCHVHIPCLVFVTGSNAQLCFLDGTKENRLTL